MTLILGAVGRGNVYIGSDSRATCDNGRFEDQGHKLLRIKNFVVGYSASYRTAQIIEFNKTRFNNINNKSDLFKFTVELKKLMIDNGHNDKANGSDELSHDALSLLIGTKCKLFILYSNYQFAEVKVGAIGSGGQYAEGYFDALDEATVSARIHKTIKATSKRVNSVGGRITVWRV